MKYNIVDIKRGETEKSLSQTSATVRLIPSIAIEPFCTINPIISISAAILTQTAFSSTFLDKIFPTPNS